MNEAAEALAARIRAGGPIPLRNFMAAAVAAYYRRPRVFGRAGDFVTAPEISQVFGELVGLWFALRWLAAGRPDRFVLAECGPGRGTLIADALRAAASVPGFRAAVEVHLVETSPTLRAAQAEALDGVAATWHDDLATLPDAPLHLIANEFLDALPVRQYVFRNREWRERYVACGADDGFAAVDGPAAAPPADLLAALPPPAEGDVIEHAAEGEAAAAAIAARIAASGGAALIFDYGHASSGYGDTVQAVARHHTADPFAAPGEADLTAHVDFARIAAAVRTAGAAALGPLEQGVWLLRMGLRERTAALIRNATPEQARLLASGAQRLAEPLAMGRLFKTLAILPVDAKAPEEFISST